jgi:tetratricopeptide (TPR) repeat protein
MALSILGVLHQGQAEYDSALGYFQQALALHREVGDEFGVSASLSNISECLLPLGRIAEAEATASEALSVSRRIGHRRGEAEALVRLGLAVRAAGRSADAAEHWRAAAAIFEQTDSDGVVAVRAYLAELGL